MDDDRTVLGRGGTGGCSDFTGFRGRDCMDAARCTFGDVLLEVAVEGRGG